MATIRELRNAKLDSTTAPTNGTATEEPKEVKGVLYVGIDLGTSRTSVSASNGERATVSSYVGYPKDVVARKLLKKDVLFGEEAVQNRLALKLYRPLEHGVIKGSNEANGQVVVDENLKAARDLMSHAITLAKPRADELIYGVIGAPAQASVKNQKALLEAARETLDSV